MKKVLSLFLALVMVLMICGNSVSVFASDFEKAIGVWKLLEITGDDNVMSREDVEAYEAQGVAMYLKLRENGTAKFSVFGEDMEGTWDEYGIVLDNSWLTYILDKDQLVVDNLEGGEMVFQRSSMDEIYWILGYQKGVLDEDVKYSDKDTKIMDTDTASVVVTGYEADMTGFTVRLRCKNKTKNSIAISADKCVINKYIFHPEWDVTLESRETQDTEFTISPAEFEKANISAVDELILQLRINNAINDKVIKKGIKAVAYPTGKKAADIKPPQRTPVENELVVINDKTGQFIIQGLNPDDEMGLAMNCFVANPNAHTLNFVLSDVTINGVAVKTSYEEAVYPGARGYSDVIFLNDNLQDLGINSREIKEIKGTVKAYDKTGSKPVIVAQKAFTYQP